jgi:uncharacterized membrane protein (UPF0127 family)
MEKNMKILNSLTNQVLCDHCKLADTFIKRLTGLMFKKNLSSNEGLYITKCNSIHMFFMRFSIDIIFIDKNSKIVYLLKDFKPWRISKIVNGAKDTLELPSGTIERLGIRIGDIIKFEQ